MAPLLRLACILKEPMISRKSFGNPVKCIGTTSCLQTAEFKYINIIFKKTLSSIVFAALYAFLVGSYAFFWPYHPDVYDPHTGTFFLWFSKEIACWAERVI